MKPALRGLPSVGRPMSSLAAETTTDGWYAEDVMNGADLHRLVDELPEDSIEPTAVVLERARNPLWAVLKWLRRTRVGDG